MYKILAIDGEIKLDDVRKIQRLIDLADGMELEPVKAWIRGFGPKAHGSFFRRIE